jgi:hypothetical protein
MVASLIVGILSVIVFIVLASVKKGKSLFEKTN